ncbi:cell division protein FtsX [Nocardiopsis sp. CNR-923]|uniref:ABC transporter permease n=1 Tax=Nocardiopsis sp. CNR-923 TaxID=1904965 RepID=UPI000966445C|nr:ABC transporter permease [Nocardiopsis sp. CNR-923]OLT27627.1 cell division protein FtsX [Nocardiopsis sp. CNR-923]
MLRSLTAGIVLAFAGSRANIARTILSCAGVVIGVGALIVVVMASDFGQRYAVAYSEIQGGLPATLEVVVDDDVTDRGALEEDLRRSGGEQVSLYQMPSDTIQIRSGDATVPDVDFLGVDAELGDIRRLDVARGRWFAEEDTESLAPVLVVNESLASQLSDVTRVQIGQGQWVDARVVGVVADTNLDFAWQTAYLLRSPATEEMLFASAGAQAPSDDVHTTYVVRLDPEHPGIGEFGEGFARTLSSAGWRWGVDSPEAISSYRVDSADLLVEPLRYMTWGLLGIAFITLGTGLLGVLNVGLVTVRERRRELATYRALGASRFTLFVAVVMEAVVVAFVAGVIALAGCWALAALGSAVITELGLVPPGVDVRVPANGVLLGLGSASGVGLLAGIIPAARALRASVVAGLRE